MVAATTVAELWWLPPAVRNAGEDAPIVADGTNCRR
jgi:hypothetical protein